MISVYSVCSAVLFFNLAIVLVYFLLKKTEFVVDYTVSALLLITVLATARLFLPVDMDNALVLRSKYVLPTVQSFLTLPVFHLPISVGGALLAVWLTGTLIYLGRDIFIYARAKRAEREFIYVTDEKVQKEAGLLGIKCAVRISPDVAAPYSARIFRPTIYLPDWNFSEDELCAILRHEQQHVRSLDAVKKLIFLMIEAVFWWNPVAHVFRREFDQLVEINCDYKLMAGKEPQERIDYANTLLSVMKRAAGERENLPCSSAFSNNAGRVMQRFELVLNDRPPKAKRARAGLNFVFAAAFLLSFFVIIQPCYEPPAADIEGVHIITEDNSFILHEDGKYYLYYDNRYLTELREKDLRADNMKDLPIIEADANETD